MPNIHVTGVLEGKQKEIRAKEKNNEEIMTKTFPEFGQRQIKATQPITIINVINVKKALPRHIVIKRLKTINTEQILKAIREK